MLQTNYDNFMGRVVIIYSMMYDIPNNSVWKAEDRIAYFDNVVYHAERDPSDSKLALAAEFSKAAINYLGTGLGFNPNSAMGEFAHLNNLYRLNQELGTNVTVTMHNVQYGLVDHIKACTTEPLYDELRDKVKTLLIMFNTLSVDGASDPTFPPTKHLFQDVCAVKIQLADAYAAELDNRFCLLMVQADIIFNFLQEHTYGANALSTRKHSRELLS